MEEELATISLLEASWAGMKEEIDLLYKRKGTSIKPEGPPVEVLHHTPDGIHPVHGPYVRYSDAATDTVQVTVQVTVQEPVEVTVQVPGPDEQSR